MVDLYGGTVITTKADIWVMLSVFVVLCHFHCRSLICCSICQLLA